MGGGGSTGVGHFGEAPRTGEGHWPTLHSCRPQDPTGALGTGEFPPASRIIPKGAALRLFRGAVLLSPCIHTSNSWIPLTLPVDGKGWTLGDFSPRRWCPLGLSSGPLSSQAQARSSGGLFAQPESTCWTRGPFGAPGGASCKRKAFPILTPAPVKLPVAWHPPLLALPCTLPSLSPLGSPASTPGGKCLVPLIEAQHVKMGN